MWPTSGTRNDFLAPLAENKACTKPKDCGFLRSKEIGTVNFLRGELLCRAAEVLESKHFSRICLLVDFHSFLCSIYIDGFLLLVELRKPSIHT